MRRSLALFSFVSLASVASLAAYSTPSSAPPKPPPTVSAASSTAPVAAPGLTAARINELLHEGWRAANVTPAPPADDATFLRRASLDLNGVIPTVDEVTAFLKDAAPDKRARAVERMLASERYLDHFTNYWDRAWLGKDVRKQRVDREAFRAWLRKELASNVGYDALVRDLLSANGKSTDEGANGAVNYFVKYNDAPADLAGATSRLFLGVQIQCAQCHDHKTEAWKMTDFRSFAACFAETRVRAVDPGGMGKPRGFEVDDEGRPGGPKRKSDPELKAIAESKPKAIDGTDLSGADSRRAALAKWITAPANPWFAKAAVNRIWSHFLGRGFVDPVTDFRPSNPAEMPELLDALAADFIASGYDVKHVIRLVTASEAYALAPRAGDAAKSFSAFRVTPLGPDELLDSVARAVDLESILDERLSAKRYEDVREQMDKQFSFLFDVDEEVDDKGYEGTIPQALFLLNGRATNDGARAVPGSAVATVLAMSGDESQDPARIRSLYLRILSREPSKDETTTWITFLTPTAKRPKLLENQRKRAFEDMAWVLLNSSELAFNH